MTEIKRYGSGLSGQIIETKHGSFVDYDDHTAIVAALQEQVRALAALAEERREFIVNGAELGYIQLPVFDDDPATATYQRCLLKPKFAAAAALREIRADGAMACGIHLREWYDYQVEERAEEFAARIRSGEQS